MTVPLTGTCPPVSFTSWSKANLSAISREFLKPGRILQCFGKRIASWAPWEREIKFHIVPFFSVLNWLLLLSLPGRATACVLRAWLSTPWVMTAVTSQPSEGMTLSPLESMDVFSTARKNCCVSHKTWQDIWKDLNSNNFWIRNLAKLKDFEPDRNYFKASSPKLK